MARISGALTLPVLMQKSTAIAQMQMQMLLPKMIAMLEESMAQA